jgi:N utilization substance protein B
MISRRLLRIKILQILYSNYQSTTVNISISEKELSNSIKKTYDLYHYCLLLLVELVRYAEQRIEIGLEKLQPTHSDLNPNKVFVENAIIKQIRKNWHLSKYLSENALNWVNHPDLIKNIYNKISESDFFISYMNLKEHTYKMDKEFVISILENELAEYEPFESVLEELSIYWNDDIEFVLSMVIKTLEGFKENDMAEKALMPLFKNDEDREFAKILLRKTLLNKEEYNKLIKEQAQNWEFERIAVMDIILMRMAITEFTEFSSIPTKVTLNEYIEIAKFYSTQGSSVFINGILDKLIHNLKKDKKIVKQGRGLIGEV